MDLSKKTNFSKFNFESLQEQTAIDISNYFLGVIISN